MKIRTLLVALTALGGVLHVVDTTSAQNWVATSAPVTNWTGVACSADGIKLVAVVADSSAGNDDRHGRIYTSADSGVTWTATSAPLDSWTSVASSADGTRLIAGSYGKPIYTSVDSGATWIESDSSGAFRSVASSNDGTKLFGVNFGPFSYIFSLTPTDGWLATDSPESPWTSVACSADGSLLIAGLTTDRFFDGTNIVVFGGSLWTSPDSGATWQFQNVPLGDWYCFSSSADGSRLVAMGSGLAYTSEDSGTNWTKAGAPLRNWTAVASSADGTKLMAVASDIKQIFMSSDAGVTWTNSGAPRADWTSVASSADGSKVVAVAGGYSAVGRIYTWRAALPALSITLSRNNALISWPASSTGFGLQENLDLNLKNWTDLTITPAVTNQQNQIMVSTSNGARFYRLNHP